MGVDTAHAEGACPGHCSVTDCADGHRWGRLQRQAGTHAVAAPVSQRGRHIGVHIAQVLDRCCSAALERPSRQQQAGEACDQDTTSAFHNTKCRT